MRFRLKVVLGCAVAALSLTGVTACSDTPTGVRSPGKQAARLSGEEVFAGIFFGEGAAGARLTGIWQGKPLEQQIAGTKAVDVSLARERMIARISSQDPTFFTRFADAVQSGSHVRVSAALDETLKLAESAMPTAGLQTEAGIHVYRVVEIYDYVAVYRYAVLFEAAFWATDQPSMLYSTEKSKLGRDIVVDEIARKLAV